MTIYEDFSSSFICSVVLVTSTLLIGLPHQYFSQSWKNKISSPIIFLLEIESFTLGVFTLPLPVCGIIGSSNASLVFLFLTNWSLEPLWPDHCWDSIAFNYEQGKFILRLEMASVCDKVPLCDWNVSQLRPPTTQPSATHCHASTTRQPTTLAAVLDQSKEEHFVGSVVGKLLLEEVGYRAANLQGLNQCTQSYRAPVSSGLRLCTSGDLVCRKHMPT